MAIYYFKGSKQNKKENNKTSTTSNKTNNTSTKKTATSSSSTSNTSKGTNVYSGMTSAQLDNERKYLNNLIAQGGGNAEWAKGQLSSLNSVTPSSTSNKTTSSSTNSTSTMPKSMEDYLRSYGVDPYERYESVKDKYKGTPNENKFTYVEDTYATKQKQNIDDYLAELGIVPQEQPQIDYEEQYRQEQLRAMEEQQEYIREQQRIANQMAVNSGVERLQNQLKTTNKGFDEAGRDAYIQATKAEYALPNQLAAMGYTGGLSETEAARSRANYQNRMADIEQQRLNAENEVYAAINDLRNTADQRTAEQNAELAREYANRLMELELEGKKYAEQKKAQDLTNWQNIAGNLYYNDYAAEIQRLQADNADGKNDAKIAYLMSLRQQKLNQMEDEEKEQAELDRKSTQQEYENAVALAKLGVFEPLQALGYDVSNLQKQWNADYNKTIASTKTGSGGSGSNSTSPSLINSILNTANKMLTEKEDVFGDGSIYRNAYDANAVKAYILSQNISDKEQYIILSNLGLI